MKSAIERVVRTGASSRAQSETIGVVLLLAMTIVGAGAVVTLGSVAVDDVRLGATTGSAEQGMTQFDSKASLVAHGESESQTVRLGGADDAQRTVDSSQGWLNVSVINATDGSVETVIMNASLGAATYRKDGETVAYQGGGVWRKTGSGNESVMLSAPEFHYRGSTVTMPLVLVRSDGTLGERARIDSAGPTQGQYPNETRGLQNPLGANKVVVTIHSEYYQAWGQFISQRTGGEVTIYDQNQTVVVDLVSPAALPSSIGSALSSSAAGDEIDMQGSGSSPARIDSYNSSNGSYSATWTDNGTLLTAGNVEMAGNSEVLGHVRSGGAVSMSGNSEVTRTVEWTSGFSATGASAYGGDQKIDGVEAADTEEQLVDNKLGEIGTTNDNAGTSAVESKQLNFTSDSVTLTDGEYYLDGIDAESGEEIVLETGTSDEIEIAVENSVQLDDAKISVQGNGTVRFYVGDDIQIKDGSNVTVPEQRSTGLWVYGDPGDSSITIEGDNSDDTRFVGVIYVPSNDDGDVSIKHAEVYGAVAGGDMDIQNGATVHYDSALQARNPLPPDASPLRITYLHVSTTKIEVTD